MEVGGNDIDVTYDGEKTNLHHIWDTQMPEQIAGGHVTTNASSVASGWAKSLSTQIANGTYAGQAPGWVTGISVSNAVNNALTWATESNADVCTVVMPQGADSVKSGDLDGAYEKAAVTTIELQIAKQGYRLAKLLDAIAGSGSNKFGRKRGHSVGHKELF